ncbi:MAG: hypothetical protein EOO56_26905 [Hymenobacter sp.]|nr:MAG: hypothetical protein EOO56_26905 [Hymenobacter sp.]
MPLIPFQHQPITVAVADRTSAGTTFKQKAQFLSLHAAQNPATQQVQVTIRVRVDLYADDAGQYGELLLGKGLSSYEVTLVADNNTAVDPQTGAVQLMRSNETAEQWQALLDGHEAPLMLQGDWFEMLLNTQQVAIGPMLRQFIEQADQPPFAKFV